MIEGTKSSPLLMHELAKPKKKERIDFDDFIENQTRRMEKLSLNMLREYRENLKRQLEGLHELLREPEITLGRKKYLKGRRMVVTTLLSRSKERIRLINTVVHNTRDLDLAVKFIGVAAEELSMDVFQKIYGRTMAELERKGELQEKVREFLSQAKTGKGAAR